MVLWWWQWNRASQSFREGTRTVFIRGKDLGIVSIRLFETLHITSRIFLCLIVSNVNLAGIQI